MPKMGRLALTALWAYAAEAQSPTQDCTIKHAGLIYGYWAEVPVEESQRRKHRGCYFINLRGSESEVESRLNDVLKQIKEDFCKAPGTLSSGVGDEVVDDYISDADPDD